MGFLAKLTDLLSFVNSRVLGIGMHIAWVAIGTMVFVILLQVFFRYVLNSALPWPEEAARALMIWMMALMAPAGYRMGAFVSIDMLADVLPPTVRKLLTLVILILAYVVLIILLQQSIKHFNSGFIFKSATLKIPLAWIYLAMTVCFGLMISVTTEMVLRTLGRMFGNPDDFPTPAIPRLVAEE